MGRHQDLEQCRKPADVERFVTQHGGSVRQCKGSHVRLYGRRGELLGTMTTHGELGPHTKSALTKALAVLLAIATFVCAVSYLVGSL